MLEVALSLEVLFLTARVSRNTLFSFIAYRFVLVPLPVCSVRRELRLRVKN
jgi:hypothetical protein